jgi:hypothetical protein
MSMSEASDAYMRGRNAKIVEIKVYKFLSCD